MARTIYVSSPQKSAARAMVQRSVRTGRKVSTSVRKIADAKVGSPKDHTAPGKS